MSSEPPATTSRSFPDEIVSIEPRLRAYLHRKFPRLYDVDDVVQESYLRVFRLHKSNRLRSPRGAFFVTARNVVLDLIRRRQRSPIDTDGLNRAVLVADEGTGPVDAACLDQELALLSEAIASLPGRCREVLTLRKIHGLSHREIAIRLGMAERTVNVQIGLGVRRCAAYLQARGLDVP